MLKTCGFHQLWLLSAIIISPTLRAVPQLSSGISHMLQIILLVTKRHISFFWPSVPDSLRDEWVSFPGPLVDVIHVKVPCTSCQSPQCISLSRGTLGPGCQHQLHRALVLPLGTTAGFPWSSCFQNAVGCCCHNTLSSKHSPATSAPISCVEMLLLINSVQRYMGLCGKP